MIACVPVKGYFEVNCYLWIDDVTKHGFLIDPGAQGHALMELCRDNGWIIEKILLTHGHFDHIGGIPGILAAFPDLPVYAHPSDSPMFGHPMNQYPPEYPGVAKPTKLLDIRTATKAFPCLEFEVLETPGHTPGSVCLKFGDLLLSGDTLFAGSCGRTDFPGGSMAAMRRSLAELAQLPPETKVVPGHGGSTTIGHEVATNPFMEI